MTSAVTAAWAVDAAGSGETGAVERLRRVEGLAIVALTWLLLATSLVAVRMGRTGRVDALFESMSGLTTTGATAFTDFTTFGHGCSSGGR